MRGMRLVLALLCLGLALPASAQSPYAGVYIGDVTDIPGTTDTGWFAVMVRDNGIAFAIFIDFTAFSDGASTDNITVKSDGSFAFDLPHPNPDVMQPGRKVVGTIAFGVISGDVCDFTLNSGDPGCPGSGGNNPLDAKFSAARSPSTGLFAQFGGIYAGMITGGGQESGVQVSADGPIVAIADATGQALVLASPRLTLGSTPQGVVDMAGLVQIDPAAGINYALSGGGQLFGTINFLLPPPSGNGTWSATGANRNLSGTWTLARVDALPTGGPDEDIDVTGITDISGDGVPDVAGLSQQIADRPRVRYYSGANRQKFDQVNYLSSAWFGIAAATLADGNQDGVRNDPAVAVLGRNIANNQLFVQVRMADGGASIFGMKFLSGAWFPVDVVIIDDPNGDGVSDDSAIGVLAINPQGSSRRRNLLQVRRLSDGSLLSNIYFANGAWRPLAAGTVPRAGKVPFLSVLLEKIATNAILVQARVLSDGALIRNIRVLDNRWRAKDLAIFGDTNGDSVFVDASYAVLAVNPGNGKNVVRVVRPGGLFVKNIFVLNDKWRARRIGRTDDISGNLFEEIGTLGNKIIDGDALIQLKDFATTNTTGNISP